MPIREQLPDATLIHRAFRGIAAISILVVSLAAPCGASADTLPTRFDRHSGVYDSARARSVIFGGFDGLSRSNQTWSLTLADTPHWDSLASVNPAPPGRAGHCAIYDPVRDQLVVFGGSPEGGAGLNETWTRSLASPETWTQLSPAGQLPSPRLYSSAIYDPLRDRMLIFGGGLSGYFNDVWALSLGGTPRWDSLAVAPGSIPSPRQGHAAIYDPLRDRMIVFGGLFASTVTWQFSFSNAAWTPISTLGAPPSARSGHSATYDPVGDRLLVFGGLDGNGQRLNEVYELSLGGVPTWSRLAPTGSLPSPRFYHSADYDMSRHAIVVFGGDHSGTDETWALSLLPAPAWSPWAPVLAVSGGELNIPTVTVGDTASVTFTIANTGLGRLGVSSIRLPFGELSLNAPAPLDLPWRATVTETLILVASQPRTSDSLFIDSNDPRAPSKSVPLRIDVRGLGFDSRVLGSPARVPLGTAFIVIVTPHPSVRVERGSLFYRIGGSTAAFDSVALTPLATDFIAAVPAAAVTERGVEYYIRIENSGYRATQPDGAPSAGVFAQAVEPPASLAAVPQPTSGSDFLAARAIDVVAVLPAGAEFLSGTIHFREGGTESYESDTLAKDVLGRPVATTPARIAGPRGVEYWIETRTVTSTLRFPATSPEYAVIRTRVGSLTEPSVHAGGRYRLLSVPLDFGVDFAGSLDAILVDQLGTYDPVRWRAYAYDPVSAQNFEFSPARLDAFHPQLGRSFWLISREPHRVNTDPIAGLSTRTGRPYAIALAPGWNQIANPFDFPVAWADVVRDTTAIGKPVAFDPARGSGGDYSDVAPLVLAPFEGYFVENVGAGPETLWVPPKQTSPVTVAALAAAGTGNPASLSVAAARQGSLENWRLRLAARTEHAVDEWNEFGVSPGAADAFDALDLRKPPCPPGPWVRLAITHRDWDTMPGAYRRDLRQPGSTGYTCEFEVLSATAGEAVMIELSEVIPVASGQLVRLIDREQGSVVDVLRSPVTGTQGASRRTESLEIGNALAHYRLVSYGPQRSYRLAVIVGDPAYVTHALDDTRAVPARLTLDQNAPNPFGLATRIRFGLPTAAIVHAEIFNLLGERVVTLMDRERLAPGQHTLVWEGSTAKGVRAPNGVYMLRVATDKETTTRRLVVIR